MVQKLKKLSLESMQLPSVWFHYTQKAYVPKLGEITYAIYQVLSMIQETIVLEMSTTLLGLICGEILPPSLSPNFSLRVITWLKLADPNENPSTSLMGFKPGPAIWSLDTFSGYLVFRIFQVFQGSGLRLRVFSAQEFRY